ncbi:ParB N-terminal domain-containing protein [Aneurinibacillus migulanus]|uniref:Chromosome partitioning protein, ParB family n=1 Tax=Aneurinibacillus migulanus TaxID=47500 RepID=A0A0D1WNL3_ANEMI|nr:ParB N-terminal domain-containing protein [Aneurinibacillus migulanus]KIV60275.1 hypothetical protein TS65_00360 [Aneurinibacillus migulanus]KON90526.1 hypothetical protein AF333_29045 [Aneurinibacillus migulanus]MED0894888.1 ParB N-terminal domain-containing protein [Aneurinibacillus migulanus]MED1614468.1 ParB N-terminal domain-containing protein [Aneurinibacillus migulanus]SDJ76904.1 chromosome partitioning protein, ParB family [Aneurinibacillus migulanus]
MLLDINKIKVNDRIRKDFGNIEELAQDIKENGLINPPVVTPNYTLIAGERRLRACKHLEYQQIEVRVMTIRDYEHQLRMEISENENRKEFTFSERVEWARRLEEIERLKAKERMETGGQENFPEGQKGQVRDIVADQAGFGSGKQYEKAKFITENADDETIRRLDEDKISIHKAYTELKQKLQKSEQEKEKAEKQAAMLQKELKKEQSKPPKIIEREVTPQSVERKLQELEQQLKAKEAEIQKIEAQKRKVEDYMKMQERDAEEYRRMKEQLRFLSSQRDNLHRQIESATALSGLVVEIEHFLQTKLAPVKYSRAFERLDSQVALKNIEDIVANVEDWCKEIRSLLPNGNYIELEAIPYE